MNSQITDPSAFARASSAELCQEAARRLCNSGMGLVAGEVATFRRGSARNHLLTFAIFASVWIVLGMLGVWFRP